MGQSLRNSPNDSACREMHVSTGSLQIATTIPAPECSPTFIPYAGAQRAESPKTTISFRSDSPILSQLQKLAADSIAFRGQKLIMLASDTSRDVIPLLIIKYWRNSGGNRILNAVSNIAIEFALMPLLQGTPSRCHLRITSLIVAVHTREGPQRMFLQRLTNPCYMHGNSRIMGFLRAFKIDPNISDAN
jgi:hypothetical protein